MLAVVPAGAWPAEPVDVAQPATRRMLARTPRVPAACSRVIFMRPDCIEVAPPTFDDDLGFAQGVEDFAIEQFIAQASVEALDKSVFPRTAWLDIGRLCADRCDLLPHGLGHELRPIVRPDVARNTTQDEDQTAHRSHRWP